MYTGLANPVLADGCQLSGGGSGWSMGGMVIWMVVFWAALILGILWLVRTVSLGQRLQREQEPEEILDRRLPESESTFDEYREQKAALPGEQTHPQDRKSTQQIAGGLEA